MTCRDNPETSNAVPTPVWHHRILSAVREGTSQVGLRHDAPVARATFDDSNLVWCAGLVPVMRLAQQAGLHDAVADRVSLPTDKGVNPAGKVATIVAGMLAGADSIDDLDVARHGGMRSLFDGVYAPSTLGSFLRTFSHGHVRELQAAARDTLIGLAQRMPLLAGLDAQVEQVGQAADVAAGGVGLVQDAILADRGDRQVGADRQPDPAFAAFGHTVDGLWLWTRGCLRQRRSSSSPGLGT